MILRTHESNGAVDPARYKNLESYSRRIDMKCPVVPRNFSPYPFLVFLGQTQLRERLEDRTFLAQVNSLCSTTSPKGRFLY